MDSNAIENHELDLDTKLLSNLIYELNISRRYVTAYPDNHPIIASSSQKVLLLLHQLLEFREEVTIGIAGETLIIGNSFLDRNNPVYRDFARLLFGHGIAAITLQKQLSREELHSFNVILTYKREFVRDNGGIEQMLANAGIWHLQVKGIDYDSLRATEEEHITPPSQDMAQKQSPSLWEQFIHGLLEGTLDPRGGQGVTSEEIDPKVVAEIINRQFTADLSDRKDSYEAAITSFMRQVDRDGLAGKNRADSFDKLSAFVSNLHPELRRQFLNSTFRALPNREEWSEELLTKFPSDVILEALEDVSSHKSYTPPVILKVLEKLSKNIMQTERTNLRPSEGSLDEQDIGCKLRLIFREDSFDTFLPDAYQKTLRTIITAEKISALEQEEVDNLKNTLTSHYIETQVSAIILEIINSMPVECQAEVLQRNLVDLCHYFLEMGDFSSLVTIYDRLSGNSPDVASMSAHVREEVLSVFIKPEFLEEVLNSLGSWGKAKYPDIQVLIQKVGAPFVNPLMNRLADEPNMSLRRYYMDRLLELGEATKEEAIVRLEDNRWYYIRNMVIILRNLNNPSVLSHIYRLVGHPHARVHYEVLKTLIHFQDPEGDRLLLLDMAGTDYEVRLSAIQLAENSENPEVFRMLLGFLRKGGIAGTDFEIKRAVIATLAEIGNVDALPELERLLRSRNLLRPSLHNRLKAEAVCSLERYPAEAVGKLLEKLTDLDTGELGRLIAETRKNLQGRGA